MINNHAELMSRIKFYAATKNLKQTDVKCDKIVIYYNSVDRPRMLTIIRDYAKNAKITINNRYSAFYDVYKLAEEVYVAVGAEVDSFRSYTQYSADYVYAAMNSGYLNPEDIFEFCCRRRGINSKSISNKVKTNSIKTISEKKKKENVPNLRQANKAIRDISKIAYDDHSEEVAKAAVKAIKDLMTQYPQCNNYAPDFLLMIASSNDCVINHVISIIDGLQENEFKMSKARWFFNIGRNYPKTRGDIIKKLNGLREDAVPNGDLDNYIEYALYALGVKTTEEKKKTEALIKEEKDQCPKANEANVVRHINNIVNYAKKDASKNKDVVKSALDAIVEIAKSNTNTDIPFAVNCMGHMATLNPDVANDAMSAMAQWKDKGITAEDLIAMFLRIGDKEECKKAAIDNIKSVCGSDEKLKPSMNSTLAALGVKEEEKKDDNEKKDDKKQELDKILKAIKEGCVSKDKVWDSIKNIIYQVKVFKKDETLGDKAIQTIQEIGDKYNDRQNTVEGIKAVTMLTKHDAGKTFDALKGIYGKLADNNKEDEQTVKAIIFLVHNIVVANPDSVDKALDMLNDIKDEEKAKKGSVHDIISRLNNIKRGKENKQNKQKADAELAIQSINSLKENTLKDDFKGDANKQIEEICFYVDQCPQDSVAEAACKAIGDIAGQKDIVNGQETLRQLAVILIRCNTSAPKVLDAANVVLQKKKADISAVNAQSFIYSIGKNYPDCTEKAKTMLETQKGYYKDNEAAFFDPYIEDLSKKEKKDEEEKKELNAEEQIQALKSDGTSEGNKTKDQLDAIIMRICLVACSKENAGMQGLGNKAIEAIEAIDKAHEKVLKRQDMMTYLARIVNGASVDAEQGIESITNVWNASKDEADGNEDTSITLQAANLIFRLGRKTEDDKKTAIDALGKMKDKSKMEKILEVFIGILGKTDVKEDTLIDLINKKRDSVLNGEEKKKEKDDEINTDSVKMPDTMLAVDEIFSLALKADSIDDDTKRQEVKKTALEALRDIATNKDIVDRSKLFGDMENIVARKDDDITTLLDGMEKILDKMKPVNPIDYIAGLYNLAEGSEENAKKVVEFLRKAKDYTNKDDKSQETTIDVAVRTLQPEEKEDDKKGDSKTYEDMLNDITNKITQDLSYKEMLGIFNEILGVVKKAKIAKQENKDAQPVDDEAVAISAIQKVTKAVDNAKLDISGIVLNHIGIMARIVPTKNTADAAIKEMKKVLDGYDSSKKDIICPEVVSVPYLIAIDFRETKKDVLGMLTEIKNHECTKKFIETSGHLLDHAINSLEHDMKKSGQLTPVDLINLEKTKFAKTEDKKEDNKKDKEDTKERMISMGNIANIAIDLADTDQEQKIASAAVDAITEIQGSVPASVMLSYIISIMRANKESCQTIGKKITDIADKAQTDDQFEMFSITHKLYECGLSIMESRDDMKNALAKMKDNAKDESLKMLIEYSIKAISELENGKQNAGDSPTEQITIEKKQALDQKDQKDHKAQAISGIRNIQRIAMDNKGDGKVGDAAVSAVNDIFKGCTQTPSNEAIITIWVLTMNCALNAETAVETIDSIAKDAKLLDVKDKDSDAIRKTNPTTLINYLYEIGANKAEAKDKVIEVLKGMRKDHTELADTTRIAILKLGGSLDEPEQQDIEVIQKIKNEREICKGGTSTTTMVAAKAIMELATPLKNGGHQDVMDAGAEALAGIFQDNKENADAFMLMRNVRDLVAHESYTVDKALDAIKDLADGGDTNRISMALDSIGIIMKKYCAKKDYETSHDKALSVLKDLKDKADDDHKAKANEVIVTIGGMVTKEEEEKLSPLNKVRNASLRGMATEDEAGIKAILDIIHLYAVTNTDSQEIQSEAIGGLHDIAKNNKATNRSLAIHYIRSIADKDKDLATLAITFIININSIDRATDLVTIESLLRIGMNIEALKSNCHDAIKTLKTDSKQEKQAEEALKRLGKGNKEDEDKNKDKDKDNKGEGNDQSMDVPQEEDNKEEENQDKIDNTNSIPVEPEKKEEKEKEEEKEEEAEEQVDIEPFFKDVVKLDGVTEENEVEKCKEHYESYDTAYQNYKKECENNHKQPDDKVVAMIYLKYCDLALNSATKHKISAADASEIIKTLILNVPDCPEESRTLAKNTRKTLDSYYEDYLKSDPDKLLKKYVEACKKQEGYRDYFMQKIYDLAIKHKDNNKFVDKALANIAELSTNYDSITTEKVLDYLHEIGKATPSMMARCVDFISRIAASDVNNYPVIIPYAINILTDIVKKDIDKKDKNAEEIRKNAIKDIDNLFEANPEIGDSSNLVDMLSGVIDNSKDEILYQTAFKTLCDGYEKINLTQDSNAYLERIFKYTIKYKDRKFVPSMTFKVLKDKEKAKAIAACIGSLTLSSMDNVTTICNVLTIVLASLKKNTPEQKNCTDLIQAYYYLVKTNLNKNIRGMEDYVLNEMTKLIDKWFKNNMNPECIQEVSQYQAKIIDLKG